MEKIKELFLRKQVYILLVVIGIGLKFYGIDKTFFWFDEIATIQHTAGSSDIIDFEKLYPKDTIVNITDFTDILHLKKHNLNIVDQFKGMSNNINLNPLHYSLLVFWYRIAGDDDVDYRYFNLFVFLLTLPVLFELCKLLFRSSLSGWVAISIFSIMPFIQFYVHEARYNILCILLIVLSQYLFLKSLEKIILCGG